MSSNTEAARALLTTGDGTLKFLYFNFEGAGEPVRMALSVADIPFDDVRMPYQEWAAKKPTMKHGVVPQMTLPDGTIVTESMAMLRLAGEADPEGKLYPPTDVLGRLKIEQVLGCTMDMTRAWQPAMYIGMRPQKFGYPPKDEWADADATIKKLRADFIEKEMPRFLGYFKDYLKEGGDQFLCGESLTIADIHAYNTIHYFRRGIADHVPKESLEPYPEILAWLDRVDAHPKVAAYKAAKKA